MNRMTMTKTQSDKSSSWIYLHPTLRSSCVCGVCVCVCVRCVCEVCVCVWLTGASSAPKHDKHDQESPISQVS